MDIVVTHVMADGTRLKSIKGAVIPADNPVYRIISKMIETRSEVDSPREEEPHAKVL